MLFRLLSTLAEFERDQLSERIESAMAHLRRSDRRIAAVSIKQSA
jgi:DNA invertase Pin-like site-specific DNA recombinase